jgi:hypothetical protein
MPQKVRYVPQIGRCLAAECAAEFSKSDDEALTCQQAGQPSCLQASWQACCHVVMLSRQLASMSA